MNLKVGDEVLLRLGPDELIAGEVVETDVPDIFSEGWTVNAVITEGGHPKFGQVGVFSVSEVSVSRGGSW